ncbi:MAG: hypothetical protein OXU38_14110 [Gemmatimonadota bacterium]|nr:hypothetical protein [Gemmatimonadota bacterium]
MMVRRRPRALAALLLLAAMFSATAEAVAGELADSSEHYEDVTSIVHQHADTDAAAACTADLQQDTDGEHIKGYDHCSHNHGASAGGGELPTPREIVIPVATLVSIEARPPDAPVVGLYHPPKA